MTGDSDNNRSEGQGRGREALSTKEVRSEGTTVGIRTGSEAAMRAMSVRENAKSKGHRKTHRVEPDGTGRKFMHLTRGDLWRESAGGVSRGHSSEEGRESGWSEGPKNRKKTTNRRPTRGGASSPAKRTRSGNCGSYRGRRLKAARWNRACRRACGGKPPGVRKEVEEGV